MNKSDSLKKNSPWFLLWFPPVLFLLVIVIFSIYFGVQAQGDTTAIAERTAQATAYILLSVQLLLLVIQFAVFRRQGLTLRDLGWQAGDGKKAWKELALGALIGAPLGVLWIFAIEPVLSTVQGSVGDYVPAGSLFPALGAAMLPFTVANVVLAPFVEENIYRGYGMVRLLPRYGVKGTILLTSLFFGLLHWSGGFWYILTTAILVGIPFAILRLRRDNIIVPFGAHLALNLVETFLLWMV
jgi:membrane protease YdiL (CAAX protease family)